MSLTMRPVPAAALRLAGVSFGVLLGAGLLAVAPAVAATLEPAGRAASPEVTVPVRDAVAPACTDCAHAPGLLDMPALVPGAALGSVGGTGAGDGLPEPLPGALPGIGAGGHRPGMMPGSRVGG